MPRLLIVEDEEVLARNLAKAFGGRGIDVKHASTVAAAIKAAAEEPPDVVLLDLRLPDGSGLDVLDALTAGDGDVAGDHDDGVRLGRRRGRRPCSAARATTCRSRSTWTRSASRSSAPCGGRRERREISYYRERDAVGGDDPRRVAGGVKRRELVARLARVTTGGPARPRPPC